MPCTSTYQVQQVTVPASASIAAQRAYEQLVAEGIKLDRLLDGKLIGPGVNEAVKQRYIALYTAWVVALALRVKYNQVFIAAARKGSDLVLVVDAKNAVVGKLDASGGKLVLSTTLEEYGPLPIDQIKTAGGVLLQMSVEGHRGGGVPAHEHAHA